VRQADGGRLAISASSAGERRRRVRQGDAGGIEPVEPRVGGPLGVEDEVLRHLAVLALPKVDEAEDFIGFLALANVGVGIAEHLGLGILGQEDQNAGLATPSLG
jgi:hypothetical protein